MSVVTRSKARAAHDLEKAKEADRLEAALQEAASNAVTNKVRITGYNEGLDGKFWIVKPVDLEVCLCQDPLCSDIWA